MAPRNFGTPRSFGIRRFDRFDARQLIMQKKKKNALASENGRHHGLGLNTNLRNLLKAKKGGRNGLQKPVNVANRGVQRLGRFNNSRFELTMGGLVRKTIPVIQNQNHIPPIENPAKKVKLIGSKLVVTKNQDGAAVQMGVNGLPQRIVPNLRMEDEDLKALEHFRKAQVLKQHLLQSFQERSQATAFSLPISSPKPISCALLVTNLHPSVTEADVIELFSDIGLISSARLCQPGTAVVVYHRPEDAEKAKDVYHNRQLDGLPMSCVLVPSNQNASGKRGITSRLGGKLDLANPLPLHLPSTSSAFGNRSLFSKPTTQSENVVFTVKLQ